MTHWSSRLLATELSVSHRTVARVWAEHDIRPRQIETLKFSTASHLEAEVRDVVGLYLDPPAHAMVPCVDEKSQIQALDRITDACHPRHRHREFLAFLKLVAKAYPRRPLHIVVDNYATHSTSGSRPGWRPIPSSRCTSP